MIKVKVYSGISITDKCGNELHPLESVKKAKADIDSAVNNSTFYSNNPDYISTMKYYGEKKNVECVFFLNGQSFGAEIDPLFADFNKSIDYQNEITD